MAINCHLFFWRCWYEHIWTWREPSQILLDLVVRKPFGIYNFKFIFFTSTGVVPLMIPPIYGPAFHFVDQGRLGWSKWRVSSWLMFFSYTTRSWFPILTNIFEMGWNHQPDKDITTDSRGSWITIFSGDLMGFVAIPSNPPTESDIFEGHEWLSSFFSQLVYFGDPFWAVFCQGWRTYPYFRGDKNYANVW